MGMFDDIYFLSDEPRFRSLEGDGELLRSFQTKDLDCNMDNYYVYEERLYVSRRYVCNESLPEIGPDGKLYLSERWLLESLEHTGEINIYTHDDTCNPVLYLSTVGNSGIGSWGDRVQERSPWVEYAVTFRSGVLVDVQHIRVETRQQVADILRKEGLEVLDDNERMTRRHFDTKKR